jgi:hypothetical protein
MDNVVYLLGAGFSAPLGLPLINNFLMKAKDMYAADSKRYSHFSEVFKRIDRMHVAKSYYRTDLFNIEEILSILEMTERVTGSDLREFIRFIKEVIEHFTPLVPPINFQYGNWWSAPFKDASTWSGYFTFVGHLLRFRCRPMEETAYGKKHIELQSSPLDKPQVKYNIISLNYDLVLEMMASLLVCGKLSPNARSFNTTFERPLADGDVGLAKLHGSVDSNNIIAPTWNKGIFSGMVNIWNAALEMLRNANHIRIIGYSLPESDAYIKYLLKAAVINSPHLKKIDVVCLGNR